MMKNQQHGLLNRRDFARACSAAALAGLGIASTAAAAKGPEEFQRGGMYYRRLGRTDLWLSLLAFGSHTSPDDRVRLAERKTALTEDGQRRRDRMIARALDLGVNLLDVYNSDSQWEPVARLIREKRNKVVVSLAHVKSPAAIDRACRLYGHIDMYRFAIKDVDDSALQFWDILRRAKEAGKIRTIGIGAHIERSMPAALREFDGLDFMMFPYNFIHARADYSQFLPEAARRQVGLIAMKPLAAGSIVSLDLAANPKTAPQESVLGLFRSGANPGHKPIVPAAVAELTRALNRTPGESLCSAAMRFVYSQPFLSSVATGMYDDRYLTENYEALTKFRELQTEQKAVLEAARRLTHLAGASWLPKHYQWLEEDWRA